jgi:hypothetical protein
MKKITSLFTLLTALCFYSQAQVAYNPFTQNIHFAPEPDVTGFECGTTPEVVFTMGLTTADDAFNASQPLGIIICVGGFNFNGLNADSIVYGSYASNFDWEVDQFAPSCLVGTQIVPLPGTGTDPLNLNPLASGDIRVKLKVPDASPIGTKLSVNVNLQVPGYMLATNSGPDDNESTETQTYCPLRIAGTVYYDTTLNNGTIYGPGNQPFNAPSGVQLYANLVNLGTGLVVDQMAVNPDGTFQFLSVAYNVDFTPINYSVILTTIPGTVGNPAPPTTLPGTWVNSGESPCNLSGSDGNPNGINSFNITNFSRYNADFGLYIPNPTGPLPVVIKNFYASEMNCAGILSWTTSSEVNLGRIEILRREEGKGFQLLTTVTPAGAANVEHSYTYTDKTIEDGKVYDYQLQFVDIDQKVNLSAVKSITTNCADQDASINLFPNPVGNEMSVLYVGTEDNNMLELELVDATGRVVLGVSTVINKGNNVSALNTAHLTPGHYFLRFQVVESGDAGSIKFVKE